jgi:hypothetical protein
VVVKERVLKEESMKMFKERVLKEDPWYEGGM